MDFYIQMGHGMQAMCEELVSYWGKTTVIISPLNIHPNSIASFSKTIKKLGGEIMFDPQMYFPRKYHKNLSKHSYWPKSDITSVESGNYASIIASLSELNKSIEAEAFILPSAIVSNVDKRWDYVQQSTISSAKKVAGEMELLHTISLTSNVLIDDAQIESIIQFTQQWDVDGVYITCEHPERYYLVDKPLWITNLLALVAGIKRQKKKVIVGYASHQMLCLALSKCDAIASGNFLNVRWFQPDHFETVENDEISRRAVWYYCPQALSEFKVPFLDIAKRMNKLSVMAPPPEMVNQYSEMLFGESIPSSTNYSEKEAHRHYLHCLRLQCLAATRQTYEETKNAHLIVLETAEQLLSGLRSKGIRGQDRDFGEIIDVNRAAIAAHDMSYQFPLTQEWNEL
jgi:hypothetical protein